MYSPVTGDYADTDNTWLRLLPGSFGMPLPAVVTRSSQIAPLESLGFEKVGSRDHNVAYREGRLGADLSSRYDIDFLLRPDGNSASDATDPPRFAGAVFADPHPDPWWNAAHRAGQSFLLVSEQLGPFVDAGSNRAQYDALMDCHITLCPLLITASAHGTGTVRPGQ